MFPDTQTLKGVATLTLPAETAERLMSDTGARLNSSGNGYTFADKMLLLTFARVPVGGLKASGGIGEVALEMWAAKGATLSIDAPRWAPYRITIQIGRAHV